MVSRENEIIGGIAIFVIIVGLVAAAVITFQQEPVRLDENMWFRITSNGNATTTALIYLFCDDNESNELFIYMNDGEWQGSEKVYPVGEVLKIVIVLLSIGEFMVLEYRIGRGPTQRDVGELRIEYISYWEMPSY